MELTNSNVKSADSFGITASVVLNYNSNDDVFALVPQLVNQTLRRHIIVIVDNASQEQSVKELVSWALENYPKATIVNSQELELTTSLEINQPTVFLILNNNNGGYSAGNNIGIRYAEALGAEAVLIANPDMRISDMEYLEKLTYYLNSDSKNYIVASRVVGLDGKDQNPLREPTFCEELLWPSIFINRMLGREKTYVLQINEQLPVNVPKVSGCCLMLQMNFLRLTNYLDENVFMYSEEPILASLVKDYGGSIIYVQSIVAVHAHQTTGHNSERMLKSINSRLYYLKKYSNYSILKLTLLNISYSLFRACHYLRLHTNRFNRAFCIS